MLHHVILSDCIKLRRSAIWLALFLLPIISVLFGCANFWMNQGVLQKEWYSLWTQVSLFYCYFFFPMLIAIVSSYLFRLEHRNHNWNAVLSAPVPISFVFLSKLFVLSIIIVLLQLLTGGLYLICGLLFQFDTSVPTEFYGWMLRGTVAGISLGALQLLVSLLIRNFALPVGICFCGCIGGMGFLIKGYGAYLPYSLISFGMGTLSQSALSVSDSIRFSFMCVLFFVLFSSIAVIYLSRCDTKAT